MWRLITDKNFEVHSVEPCTRITSALAYGEVLILNLATVM